MAAAAVSGNTKKSDLFKFNCSGIDTIWDKLICFQSIRSDDSSIIKNQISSCGTVSVLSIRKVMNIRT